VAETEFQIGNHEQSRQSVRHAEQGYSTLKRFLSDPKHSDHIPDEKREEFAAEVKRLRAALDKLGRLDSH
jgi:hypothetical protein